MPVTVKGGVDLQKALRKFTPDLAKDTRKEMANLLKPALTRGKVQIVGSTTYEEYRETIEPDRALARRFTKLDVVEMTPEDCKTMLRALMPQYELYHEVHIEDAALDAVVDLTVTHMHDRYLPDKAIDVLDSAMAKLKVINLDKELTVDLVKHEISEQAKIPLEQLTIKTDELNINYESQIK